MIDSRGGAAGARRRLSRVVGPVLLAVALWLGSAIVASAQNNQLCLMCHSNASLFQSHERGDQLVVTQEMLDGSARRA